MDKISMSNFNWTKTLYKNIPVQMKAMNLKSWWRKAYDSQQAKVKMMQTLSLFMMDQNTHAENGNENNYL